jgi:Flp pilus assembly pilin Flp
MARVRRSTLTGLTGSIRAARVRRREVNTLTSFFSYLNALRKGEEGQTMAEYGVVLAVIAIGVVAALLALSGAISSAIDSVVGYL